MLDLHSVKLPTEACALGSWGTPKCELVDGVEQLRSRAQAWGGQGAGLGAGALCPGDPGTTG